jgi:hypothetical protein
MRSCASCASRFSRRFRAATTSAESQAGVRGLSGIQRVQDEASAWCAGAFPSAFTKVVIAGGTWRFNVQHLLQASARSGGRLDPVFVDQDFCCAIAVDPDLVAWQADGILVAHPP